MIAHRGAWLAPAAHVADANVTWQPFLTRDDGVTYLAVRGEELFLLSHRDAPMFKVLALRAGAPLEQVAGRRALLVGLVANYVGYLSPKIALGSNILLMVLVLLWRPQGLYPMSRQ